MTNDKVAVNGVGRLATDIRALIESTRGWRRRRTPRSPRCTGRSSPVVEDLPDALGEVWGTQHVENIEILLSRKVRLHVA
jgi:hypothetical protein